MIFNFSKKPPHAAFFYQKRLGVHHVDFNTLLRTPKDSAKMYAEIIRQNGF